MYDKNVKLDFHDLRVKPAIISEIDSRTQVNPYYTDENDKEFLPIFTAPMDTVVDNNNAKLFEDCKIHTIIPRGENQEAFGSEHRFKALGLDEFIEQFLNIDESNFALQSQQINYVLIDIANGHMKKLLDTARSAKQKYGDKLVLMVGNIANSETFGKLAEVGVDMIRVGIGNGCFIGNTKIITKNGIKSIKNVLIGDEVLTHTGEIKKVINTKRIKYSGSLIKINDTFSTPNHEFYVLDKKYLNIVNDENVHELCEWVSAINVLRNSNYLLVEHNNYDKKRTT